MAKQPPGLPTVAPLPESTPSASLDVVQAGDVSAVAEVVDALHDRLRVSEGEVQVWYDRFVDLLAHVPLDGWTDQASRNFFDCAHFLKGVMSKMLGKSGDPASPSLEEADDLDDAEGLSLFLGDLEHFLMLDFDVRGQQPTGRLGKEFLQGACDRADELIEELRAAGADPLRDKALVRHLQRVRQHPSRLLAQVMMRRINLAFPDRPELQFHYGRALETQLLEEIDRVDSFPDSFDPHVVEIFEVMREGFLQRFRETLQSAGRDPYLLDSLERRAFHREVACALDRYGGIQPSFGADFITLIRFAFSRLRTGAYLGERHYFDHLSLGRTQEAFSREHDALQHIQQKTLKSDKCNLPNESAFKLEMERLHNLSPVLPGREVERRNAPQPPIVVILDLNGFKAVNDDAKPTRIVEPLTGRSQLFHKYPLGDQVLYQSGEAMKAALRPGQELFHFHGDEFALVLAGDTLPEVVLRILADMQENLHQLAGRLDMRRADDDSFMDLGMAAGADRVGGRGPYDSDAHDALVAYLSALMGHAKKNLTGGYRSFADKCSAVLGAGFSASGRYDRNGVFVEPLPSE